MAAVDCLVGLALAAIKRAMNFEGSRPAHGAQAAPERRRHAAVVRVLHHALALALLYELAPFAAELELVARIVDGPRDIGAQEHAAADGRDHLLERARSRFDVEVRHAMDRRPVPAARA